MFQRILRTKAVNAELEIERKARRAGDPVQRAMLVLRRAGYTNVYPQFIVKPGSKMFVVGRSIVSMDTLLNLAARWDKSK